MNFETFSQTLINHLTPMFPAGTQLSVESIPKNNGIVLSALIIRVPDTNISPTIYLNEYYKHFQNGTSIDALSEMVQKVFSEVSFKHPIDAHMFTDFEQAKKRLVFQVIDYEKNRDRLPELVHIKYLNLAIIFCCMLDLENGEIATVTIKTEHLRLWNTDFETVKKQAFENTPRLLPVSIQPIEELLASLSKENPALTDLFGKAEFSQKVPTLYVLTNTTQTCGAACMLYPSVLEDFAAQINNDFYILPSSVHEVLLLPASRRDAAITEQLRTLVQQVNDEQLPASQQLSEHIYFYSRAETAILL